MPVDAVKKKYQSLRTQYKKEKDFVTGSIRSGAGADDVYTPTWEYYTSLTFMDCSFVDPKSKVEVSIPGSDDVRIHLVIPLLMIVEEWFSLVDGLTVQENSQTASCSEVISRRKKAKRKSDPSPDIMETAASCLSEIAAAKKARVAPVNTVTDICSTTGNLIAEQLRAMPEATRNDAVFEIQRVIYEMNKRSAFTSPPKPNPYPAPQHQNPPLSDFTNFQQPRYHQNNSHLPATTPNMTPSIYDPYLN